MKKNIIALVIVSILFVGQSTYPILPDNLAALTGGDQLSGRRVATLPSKKHKDMNRSKKAFLEAQRKSKIVSDAQALLQQLEGINQFISNFANEQNNATPQEKKALGFIVEQMQSQLKKAYDRLS